MKIGDWVFYCCELDLHQITTAADLADAVEMVEDFPGIASVFATRDEALAAIAVLERVEHRS